MTCFVISKTFSFSASHQLQDLPAKHQCARMHGHNYTVDLVLAATTLDDNGMVRDYGELKPFKELLDERYDHRHLNDVLANRMPTAELLASHFFHWANSKWSEVVACRVKETDKTAATYISLPERLDVQSIPIIYFHD